MLGLLNGPPCFFASHAVFLSLILWQLSMDQPLAGFLGNVVVVEIHLAFPFSPFWRAWILGLIVQIGIVLNVL